MGEKWIGGGFKVNLVKTELESIAASQPDLIVLFTNSYDVIVQTDQTEILTRFKRDFNNARVVFSADKLCFPNEELAKDYPEVTTGYPYLNSGGFIGYASDLYDLISSK